MKIDSLLIDIQTAAKILGIKKTQAYHWANNGKMPGCVSINGRHRVYVPALQKELEDMASLYKQAAHEEAHGIYSVGDDGLAHIMYLCPSDCAVRE